jgi:phosphoribosylaminoimidazole-succinocarboxamide synthase
LWDKVTHERLDKDRFRRDLGSIKEAYQEIYDRIKA